MRRGFRLRRRGEVDTVISAIVGVAGLEATYEAIRRGKRVGLANKEVLVSGGKLVMEAVREYGAELMPVDSEHNGAHQCLRAGNRAAGVAADPHRFRRPLPQYPPGGSRFCDAGTGPQSSNLADGQPHHHRLRHPDE